MISVKSALKFVKQQLDEILSTFVSRPNYCSDIQLYVRSFIEKWSYTEEKTFEQGNQQRRIYLHYLFNDQHATDDRNRFNHQLDRYEEEIRSGN
ncbi:hypothetical protein [Enterococcus sp. AZ194]|uniref:hypothetical protein n=1 Tax=Enterococcus sp. AZ194 TaxID=2774629 RepID=UPI003F688482